ncbi:hypothetical protein [Siminovitchia terrae]|uniref:hypothetical protein n=1 Tax=Siminovitchia terrae TaxID=1914933 RepID=UPI0028A97F9F|nr:hypothetical protein [Siminovitchia terrae]
MTAGDWIQFVLAITAGIGAIFAFWNINISKKAIELQKKQWEHAAVPVYRVDYITMANGGALLVLNNTNKVAHQRNNISFTTDDVKIVFSFNGTVEKSRTQNGEKLFEEVYKGLVVKLINSTEGYICGYLQIQGEDSLGNPFRLNSNLIEFKSEHLKNDLALSQTYLKKYSPPSHLEDTE